MEKDFDEETRAKLQAMESGALDGDEQEEDDKEEEDEGDEVVEGINPVDLGCVAALAGRSLHCFLCV